MALSNQHTEWIVFPMKTIPEKTSTNWLKFPYLSSHPALAPTLAMYSYAMALCNSQDRSSFVQPAEDYTALSPAAVVQQIQQAPARREKFSLIKDVVINSFYDIVGQVVKVFPGTTGTYDIYVTDYTSNIMLYNYERFPEPSNSTSREGDEFAYIPSKKPNQNWPGPYGQMTLQVALWPPHSQFAQNNINIGDNVFLRNIRIKCSRDGSSRFEGVLHTDRRYEDRIDISVIKDREDPRVKDVLKRKRAYLKKTNQQRREPSPVEDRTKRRKLGPNVTTGNGRVDGATVTEVKQNRRNRRAQKRGAQSTVHTRSLELNISSNLNKHGKPSDNVLLEQNH